MLSVNAFELACNPEVTRWLEDHPKRATQFAADEIDELYSLQGTGGPLTAFGVETAVQRIERRRLAVDRLLTLASTDLFDTVDTLLEALHAKIQIRLAEPEAPGRGNDPAIVLAVRHALDQLETAAAGRKLAKPVVSLRCADGLELLCVVAPSAVPAGHEPTPEAPAVAQPREELSKVERAIQLFLRDPGQPIRELARKVPCSRTLLYDCPQLQRLRQAHAGRLRRGSKSKDGEVEAED